ncbi:hypothetical protein LshimejAT787_0700770 [Lyophyllum shimeji]|uniref:Transmembrane protein n=1 Tax=Lyophyllum shimeji TaxID=47721 RepID=A0A9P3UNQ3_LYOSH|nr:hypothetical protein LshimejAT787_0700770 [Lyophyllum shimeji]
MDSPTLLDTEHRLSGKGKGREQDPTERTPLLAGESSSLPDSSAVNGQRSRRGLRSRLTLVFLVSLSICLVVFSLLALLAWSYAARAYRVSPDDVVRDDLVLRPERLDVHNITSGEMWVNIEAKLGVDVGGAMGVNSDPSDGSLFRSLWKSFGRWGVRELDRVTVTLYEADIRSQADPSFVLASISTSPLIVPLSVNPPKDDSWLSHVSVLACVRPSNDTSAWLSFARDAWREGAMDIVADVRRAYIQGGSPNSRSWRNRLHKQITDVQTSIHLQVPSLPGLPPPGPKVPFPRFQDLVTLQSFTVSSQSSTLAIHARATTINPAPPTFHLTSPSFPFIVSLPSSDSHNSPIPVASVSTAPMTLTRPNVSLDISGTVLPLPREATPILSSFLSRYLSKESNAILISSPLVPELSLETIFPPPNLPPRILRNVTIKDMRIKPGTAFLTSGTVYARVVLPKGFDVGLVVSRVFPDVLVFDGEVPDSIQVPPKSPPLPDPIPEGAFGHIRPDDWLNASSSHAEPDEGEGAAYDVTAKIVDVPLEVLPGRQREFSNFVGKVVFGSEGAIAGILGSAAVSAKVKGLPLSGHRGEMELGGLPFRGSVRVRKRSMLP